MISPVNTLMPLLQSSFKFKTIENNAILKSLEQMKGNKAAGLDNIPCRLLKIAAPEIVSSLSYIICQ